MSVDIRIGGFQKFSLIDYPGLINATVFTQGCNFRCPYCHNPQLVLPARFNETIDPEWIFAFLADRTIKLDGVTLTGGEPTLQPGLPEFLRRIKALSFKIKLDTNGARPDVLQEVITENLLDFIALDIKAPLNSYSVLSGVETDTEAIEKSISIILDSGLDYQFRTTVVPTLHSKKMIEKIKSWMQRLQANHMFQDFIPSDIIDPDILH